MGVKIERMKLRDFKSFRNAVIPFVDGFIAVVGPNGSGKSNIIDALLFVLGEGSMKAMRAARVKDLVNHASKTGTAEVTLELRHGTDKYKITREIDKNGVSVYRLNGKRTTRSEIQEFLASIGVPVEGYNIILQGDVTSFIKMSPNQRREIIEEIAGISEYEDKKESALRELDKVDAKIKEANILIHERKGYIGELKKERDEAIRYMNYQKRLNLARANLIKRELEKVEKALSEKTELLNKLVTERKNLEESRSEIDGKIAQLNAEMEKLNNEIVARGEKEHLEISKKIESTRTEVKYLQEDYARKSKRLSIVKNELASLTKEISSLESELENKKKALDKLEKELTNYQSVISKKAAAIEEYRKKMEDQDLLVTSIAKKLDEYTNKIKEKQERLYTLLSEINAARERISVLKLTLDRISSETKATDEEKEMEKELESLRKEIASHKRLLMDFDSRLEKLYAEEKSLNEQYNSVDDELDKAKEKYHSIQSRIATIRSMSGNEASDAILSAAGRGELSGIVGKVEDILDYPEKYSIAIQTSAGPRLNYIITEDDVSATNAVKWLKKRKIGRTTFIPLNKVRGPEIDPSLRELENQDGVVGFLIDLVSFDKKYLPVFKYVFGDTLLVENIDVAREIGFGKVRMVTLDGDLVESTGVVTGGYKQGMLTLKELKERDELKTKIEKLQKEKDKILSQIENLRSKISEVRKERSEVELRLREKETELRALEVRLSDYLSRKSAYDRERQNVEREIETLSSQIKSKENEAKELKKEVEKLEAERSRLKEKLDRPEVKGAAKHLEEMQRELEKLRAESTDVEIRYKSLLSEIRLMEETRLVEMRAKEADLSSERIELEKSLDEIKKRIFDLENQLTQMLEKEKEINASISDLISRREEIQKELNALSEKRGSIARLLDNKTREISEVEIEKARLESRYKDVKYEWDNMDLSDFKESDKSDDELREEIESLRRKMAKLEPVNMKAIELYEKALGDLADIEEKAKKLEDEKAAILNLIDQIEKKKREVFIETFEEIRKNFQRVYKEFVGDPNAFADMKLENLEDPFSGGLIIEANPGKIVKRIEALSGGEQAVVALSFLFAVQDYKPSPFYALDEVDGPLDRANSERLAKMIKERSKLSQFIVVTHNASVIHMADQIVGISMNKKLGSSVVEVDMREYMVKSGS